MAKYCGKIGYGLTVEGKDSVWTEHVIERTYTGEVLTVRYTNDITSEKLNDDFRVHHEISILADDFAMNNFYRMKYVTLLGTRWKVTGVLVNYPRLKLSIGGVYNGPEPDEEETS